MSKITLGKVKGQGEERIQSKFYIRSVQCIFDTWYMLDTHSIDILRC